MGCLAKAEIPKYSIKLLRKDEGAAKSVEVVKFLHEEFTTNTIVESLLLSDDPGASGSGGVHPEITRLLVSILERPKRTVQRVNRQG